MFPNLETVKHGMVFVQKSHKLEHFCFHLFVFTWRRLDSKNGQIEFWAKETTSQTMACSWWRCLALLGVLFLKQLPLSISYIYIYTYRIRYESIAFNSNHGPAFQFLWSRDCRPSYALLFVVPLLMPLWPGQRLVPCPQQRMNQESFV